MGKEGNGGSDSFGMLGIWGIAGMLGILGISGMAGMAGIGGNASLGITGTMGNGGRSAGSGIDGKVGCDGNDGIDGVVSRRWRPPWQRELSSKASAKKKQKKWFMGAIEVDGRGINWGEEELFDRCLMRTDEYGCGLYIADGRR